MGLQTKETRLIELTAKLVQLSGETARISREIQELLGQKVEEQRSNEQQIDKKQAEGPQAGHCNEVLNGSVQENISGNTLVSAHNMETEMEDVVLNPLVLEFMDLPDLHEKFEFLRAMDRSTLKDSDVDTMAVVIDVTLPDGSIDDRVNDLMACIRRLLQYQNYRK